MNRFRWVSIAIIVTMALGGWEASAITQDETGTTRSLEHVAIIEAPVEHVWAMFSESDRMQEWMAPKVEIDLRVGGLIRTNYNPQGTFDDDTSIHNRILCFEPNRMLSMQNVKAPANFPIGEMLQQTWSVIYLEPMGEYVTQVRMVGLGWGTGDEWDAAYNYFRVANQGLLDQLSAMLEEEHGIDEGEGVDDSGNASFTWLSTLFVGEWKHESTGPDGSAFIAESRVEHAGDGRTLVSRGWLTMGDHRFQHGDSIVYLDPETQQIRYLNVNEQGHIAEGFIHRAGENAFFWDWHATAPDGSSSTRYRLRTDFLDSDSYRMVLRRADAPADEEPMVDIVFERQASDDSAHQGPDASLLDSSQTPFAVLEGAAYRAHIAAASAALELNRTAETKQWLDETPPALRKWEWEYLNEMADTSLMKCEVPGEPAYRIGVSPDGSKIAAACPDGVVRLFNAASGEFVREFTGHTAELFSVAFTPDGTQLASTSRDTSVILWDVSTGEQVLTFEPYEVPVTGTVFSSDGSFAVSTGYRPLKEPPYVNGLVKIWDPRTGDEIREVECGIKPISMVALSPDDALAAISGWDGEVFLVATETGELVHHWTIPDDRGGIYNASNCVAFSPDGKRVIAGSKDYTARIWEVESGQLVATLRGHDAYVNAAVYSPNGEIIATGSHDGTVRYWDAESFEFIESAHGHLHAVNGLVFLPDGSRLVSCSGDQTLRYWKGDPRADASARQRQHHWAWGFDLSPDGQFSASTGSSGTVRLWSEPDGAMVAEWPAHATDGVCIAFSPESTRLAVGYNEGVIKLWDRPTGTVLFEPEKHTTGCLAMEYSPVGDVFACMYRDGVIKVFDAGNGTLLKSLDGGAGRHSVWAFAFNRDGTHIVAPCGEDVVIWDVATGEITQRLRGNASAVSGAKFSPDDRFAASIASDGSVALWDAETGEFLWIAHGHETRPMGLAFHPDGSRLVTTAQEIRIWDVESGRDVLTLRMHAGSIGRAEFSPDGSRLLSADWNDRIIVSHAGASRRSANP